MSETNMNEFPLKRNKRFDFEAFDSLITTALKEALDEQMLHEDEEWEEEKKWSEHDRIPGRIGSVVTPLDTL